MQTSEYATYEAVVVNAKGTPVKGAPTRRYRTTSPRNAAENAAEATMSHSEWLYSVTTGSDDEAGGGEWAFRPSSGALVIIRVRPVNR